METFQTLLAKRLADALTKAGFPNVGELTQATDPRFGDYQTNAALVLGKQGGENPKTVAEKILQHLDVADLSDSPTVAGAGFINFKLLPNAVARKTRELFADERLGVARSTSPKKMVAPFGVPSFAGTVNMDATCRGAERAIRTRFSSPSSCFSKPKSRRCCRIIKGGCNDSQILLH